MSTQDTADAELYATYRCCQWAQLRCHLLLYGNATQHAAACCVRRCTAMQCVCVCVNIAIEINVLYYSIVVHSVNGVLCIIIGLLVSDQSAQRS